MLVPLVVVLGVNGDVQKIFLTLLVASTVSTTNYSNMTAFEFPFSRANSDLSPRNVSILRRKCQRIQRKKKWNRRSCRRVSCLSAYRFCGQREYFPFNRKPSEFGALQWRQSVYGSRRYESNARQHPATYRLPACEKSHWVHVDGDPERFTPDIE